MVHRVVIEELDGVWVSGVNAGSDAVDGGNRGDATSGREIIHMQKRRVDSVINFFFEGQEGAEIIILTGVLGVLNYVQIFDLPTEFSSRTRPQIHGKVGVRRDIENCRRRNRPVVRGKSMRVS